MSDLDVYSKDETFQAPAVNDMIDGLISQYKKMRSNIIEIAEYAAGDMGGAIHYFLEGNRGTNGYMPSVNEIFRQGGALAALNSAYWSKALAMTDVLNVMPQKRRDEWFEQIKKNKAPDFEEETVRSTLDSLLSQRHQFLAERVDGIFRALSHDHVTNIPQGFGKRMILGYVFSEFSFSSTTQCGYINDLRSVIAKFMGRDEPMWSSSQALVNACKHNWGQWHIVDAGAMRIRVYKKGTAHLEIHPNIAYRLNQILAFLHPMAIPAEFRTKPAKKHKEFEMMGRPLPFKVVDAISGFKRDRTNRRWSFRYGITDKVVMQEAVRVIELIGGVFDKNFSGYEFDYDPTDALNQIICSGCIPDQKSHQYYPTPLSIAEEVIITADIQAGELCLEPSAGQGGLADLMPKDQTICIEISELHCKILQAKGHDVKNADFLSYNFAQEKFDKIVMNPPYSEGRWQAHINHATTMLKPNGSIIAVLPSSAKNKDVLPGYKCSWSREFKNEFESTSIGVVIMKATKGCSHEY